MANLTSKAVKVISDSVTKQVFGSLVSGSPVTSTDPEVLLANAQIGWQGATLKPDNTHVLPASKEMDAIEYSLSYYLKNFQQNGIPEWVATQTYNATPSPSIVKQPGTTNIYASLVDSNLNQALTDNTKWQLLGDLSLINTYLSTFNAANKLVKLDSSAKYPALDGSNILNIGGIPKGYLYGFTLSNNTTTPNTVIDIQDGVARDNSDAVNIKIDTVFSKSISSSFTAGDGNGGRGTGVNLVNGTWYHVFAISNGSTSDVYFDTSVSAQNIPTGYTYFRRLGSIYYIDGTSGIRRFTQVGNYFEYTGGGVQDFNGTLTTTETLLTLSTPPIRVNANLTYSCLALAATANRIYLRDPNLSSKTNTEVGVYGHNNAIYDLGDKAKVLTNSSRQIYISTTNGQNASLSGFIINTVGYEDISLGVVNNSASQSITGSNTQNGYVILPNGLIMQWGRFTTSSSGFTNITFPIAFPTALFSATATLMNNTNSYSTAELNINSATLSNIPAALVNGTNNYNVGTISWQAIGY